jgi:hypothetical protein
MKDETIITSTYNMRRWAQIIPQSINIRASRFDHAQLVKTQRFDNQTDAEQWAIAWVGGKRDSIRKEPA